MVRKIVLAVVIMAVGITIATCGISQFEEKQASPPDIAQARFYISTSSRNYYAVDVEETNTDVIISRYWSNYAGKWFYNEDSITLARRAYGAITVVER